jgi:phosphate transport system substrate-binding protein
MSKVVVAVLVVALTLGIVGSAMAQVKLNGAGATFPEPLYNKWFYDFSKQTGMQVNYQGIGSGGGIKAITAGTVDFAGSDAPLSNSDLAAMPAPIIQIPTVGGAVALAHNVQGVGKQIRLSPALVSGIFLGQITRWNDAKIMAENPGANLPNKAITVVHRSDGSGTTFLFTSYLAAVSPTWKSQVGAGKDVKWPIGEGGKGNPGVAGLIKQIPGSIGYVELVYAAQNRLPVVAVKNRAGKYVTPSAASASAAIKGAMRQLKADNRSSVVNSSGAEAYPISGLTFILVYTHPKSETASLVKLLKYCLSAGAQQTAAQYQYAPLPADLIAMNNNLIGRIK